MSTITVSENLTCQVNVTFYKTWFWRIRQAPEDPEEDPEELPYEPAQTGGFTGKMEIRNQPRGQIFHTLTTENGGLLIDDAGKIEAIIPREITNTFMPADWSYDLIVKDLLGTSIKLLEGKFTVIDSITLGMIGPEEDD